ncbi:MAG TPA: TolC family protein [Saprospiraceae bacterium]|nr:TolC family protein [Saprospiraceae bacterium]
MDIRILYVRRARRIFVLCLASLWGLGLTGQSLSLDSCYAMARRNYPLVQQFDLIEKSKALSLENAAKGYLPQLAVNGQATYQSEVTRLPISFPGLNVPELSKDQYRLFGEVNQPLTDLFFVKEQQDLIRANAALETQKTEVELHKLRERVYQLYFGVLYMDARLEQAQLLIKDLEAGLAKVQAAVAGGVALKSQADQLRAELLKARQQIAELKSGRRAYAEALGLLTRQNMDEKTVLETPAAPLPATEIRRPELAMFGAQQQSLVQQSRLINNKTLPRLSAFFQGGYGRPALNVLSNDFDPYFITGLRLNWNISSFYTSGNERQLLSTQQSAIALQRETFLLNTRLAVQQQQAEIAKWQELIVSDGEIILLRESVKNTAQQQLSNGTVTTTDYLNYVNAEDLARQQLILHRMQLLLAQYNHLLTTGN